MRSIRGDKGKIDSRIISRGGIASQFVAAGAQEIDPIAIVRGGIVGQGIDEQRDDCRARCKAHRQAEKGSI